MKRISVSKNNKGFTLVELIVVLVILAILAAVLIPALLGYVDRAKNQQYIVEAKELMKATQAGIVEAYAQNKKSFEDSVRSGKLNPKYVSEDYGAVTNGWIGYALDGTFDKNVNIGNADKDDNKGGNAKAIICKKIANYLDAKDLKVTTKWVKENASATSYIKDGRAFFIAYNRAGQIVYMQYAVDGRMVTFDGSSFSVEEDGKFIAYANNDPPTTTPTPAAKK